VFPRPNQTGIQLKKRKKKREKEACLKKPEKKRKPKGNEEEKGQIANLSPGKAPGFSQNLTS